MWRSKIKSVCDYKLCWFTFVWFDYVKSRHTVIIQRRCIRESCKVRSLHHSSGLQMLKSFWARFQLISLRKALAQQPKSCVNFVCKHENSTLDGVCLLFADDSAELKMENHLFILLRRMMLNARHHLRVL